MKRALFLIISCLLIISCSDHSSDCDRSADEASRVQTAQALLDIDASNYQSRINYWAKDITYREPVLTNSGRAEMLDYLMAVFSGSAYGLPTDRKVEIKDELYSTAEDGSMTYMATLQWSGTVGTEFFTQTGMSIIKFRAGEGCPYYHRNYYTEGDSWWNIPAEKPEINTFRNMYISIFGLTARCFDEDGDGYTKYESAAGCANPGLDCNDFVAEINPGAIELPGNGVDEDCNPLTPTGSADPSLQMYQ